MDIWDGCRGVRERLIGHGEVGRTRQVSGNGRMGRSSQVIGCMGASNWGCEWTIGHNEQMQRDVGSGQTQRGRQ